jgi:hypothetical protein
MKTGTSALQMVTANRLIDGEVVYLDAAGDWSERAEQGQVAATKDQAEALMAEAAAAVARRKVVAPYLIEVSEQGGRFAPVRLREQIRAAGPTVRRDLGKQAATE